MRQSVSVSKPTSQPSTFFDSLPIYERRFLHGLREYKSYRMHPKRVTYSFYLPGLAPPVFPIPFLLPSAALSPGVRTAYDGDVEKAGANNKKYTGEENRHRPGPERYQKEQAATSTKDRAHFGKVRCVGWRGTARHVSFQIGRASRPPS